jgi:hypothetical protein
MITKAHKPVIFAHRLGTFLGIQGDSGAAGARQRDERGGDGAFRAVRGNRQRICCLTFRSWQSGASRNQEDCVDAADIAGLMQQCL